MQCHGAGNRTALAGQRVRSPNAAVRPLWPALHMQGRDVADQLPKRGATPHHAPGVAGELPVWSNAPVRSAKPVLKLMVFTQCPWPWRLRRQGSVGGVAVHQVPHQHTHLRTNRPSAASHTLILQSLPVQGGGRT